MWFKSVCVFLPRSSKFLWTALCGQHFVWFTVCFMLPHILIILFDSIVLHGLLILRVSALVHSTQNTINGKLPQRANGTSSRSPGVTQLMTTKRSPSPIAQAMQRGSITITPNRLSCIASNVCLSKHNQPVLLSVVCVYSCTNPE